MEHLNTQAADLRYLSEAPVTVDSAVYDDEDTSPTNANAHVGGGRTGSISQSKPQGSPGSASASHGDNSAASNANKRKSIDDGSGSVKQTRSKRNRYISIACNECKRRKIKCNGETPCQRCGNLNLACLYAANCCSSSFKDSDEYKQVTDQIHRLHEEVGILSQAVRSLQQSDQSRLPGDRPFSGTMSAMAPSPSQSSPSLQRVDSQPMASQFRGRTSAAFNLNVANSTITTMGYKVANDGDENGQGSDEADVQVASESHDPLLDFDKDEMVRLCRLHEEEIGIMYPVIGIQTVIAHAKNLASYLSTVRNQRPLKSINDEKTLQLKMVMCCALVVEGHGQSDKAAQLYASMETVVNRMLMSDVSDVSNLPLLALLAGYRFLSNDEILAWRVIGQVARLCLELGIHQRMGLMAIQDESKRKNALNSFWTAYILDRRWAFGTGLPFVVQDADIDPHLPIPDEYPYLTAMISYSRLGAKVWRQVSHSGPVLAQELRREEMERLDDEILNWYDTVPEDVKVRNWDKEKLVVSTPSYNLQRLRIWTYLRLNQMRIWLYTPFLHSATSIMASPEQAQRVVDLAKDTISYLSNLNNTTNLYRRVQVFYHQFLTSAIAVVFLASVHAPVRFSAVCREEFYMALELVKDLSAKSWVSKRLWRTIRSLKDVAPRFGLNADDDRHSSAALGMIGLARSHMDSSSATESPYPRFSGPPEHSAQEVVPEHNGAMIQNEMSRIFEGYVGLNGFQYNTSQTSIASSVDLTPTDSPMARYDQGGGTVFPHMREMF
ncbi:hypothetical protein B0I35DRAFT_450800 [Stachybotrys elegans]|uniref:Zn(2)-C6 fungal-type domain-containing protein n=1 Tax=Stachybotrys elegans TaxID=80388 RepID=A0A8K0WSV4_9HYPO|nr:hypothetical protein B0I35DRAFT_450800 [Stachybotrys elegans]